MIADNKQLRFRTVPVLVATCFLTLPLKSFAYEEVIVTAEKRQQNLLDVPMSLSVISDQALSQQSVFNLSDLASRVPSFQVSSPNGEAIPLFSIRGISMADYSVNQSSPIGVYLDEMYLNANYSHGLALFDLERVEVLRGPQGTLYGKNTTGGAINLVTKKPDFEDDGYAKLSFGSYSRTGLQAAYDQTLVDKTLAARLAVDYLKADGHSENQDGREDMSAIDRRAARLNIRYVITEQLEALLSLNASSSDPITQAVIPIVINPGSATVLFYERDPGFDAWDADSNKVETTDINTRSTSLTLRYTQDNLLVTSVTGFNFARYAHHADSDGMPVQVLENDWGGRHEQWSQDLRGQYQFNNAFLTAGIYVAQEDIDVHNVFEMYHGLQAFVPFDGSFLIGNNSGATVDQQYEQERSSQAVYAQWNQNITDATSYDIGLRYTRDKNSQFNYETMLEDYDRNPFAPMITNIPRESFTDDEWTGTLRLETKLYNEHLVYASYSRDYRSGAFNGAALFDPSELGTVEPETVNTYEVGAKGLTLDSRLQYATALFHNDYRNQQFINVVNVLQILENAPRAESQGLEIELDFRATEQLTVHADLSFMHSEYTEGPYLFAQGETRDLSGNKLVSTPETSGNLAFDHHWDLGTLVLDSHLGIRYTSEQWFSPFNNQYGYQDIGHDNSYSLIDARFEVTPKNNPLSVALWGTNLSNKEYKAYALNLAGFGYHYTISGAPRTYGLDLRVGF